MFLVDTNCWLQLARDRAKAAEVRDFLAQIPLKRIFVSIYTVHGIGIIMYRRGMIDRYANFLAEMRIGKKIEIVQVPAEQLNLVADTCIIHRLDFDDAYQYVAAELHGLKLVSLDTEFDRTPNGRLTPDAALRQFKEEQQ